MLPNKFWVNWSFGSGEEVKNRFSRWPHSDHLGFPIGTILLFFYLQVTLMLPTKKSTGLSVQEKKWKIDFQDGSHGVYRISDRNYFSYFWPKSHPDTSYHVSSFSLSVQEKKWKIDFQDGRHCRHLGFLIRTILAIFDLQVTQMLPTKFRVNWPFGSGKNRFSRLRHGCHLGFPILTIYIYKFRVSWPFGLGEVKNTFSRWRPWRILDFLYELF